MKFTRTFILSLLVLNNVFADDVVSTWHEARINGKGKVYIHYYDSENFISTIEGKPYGIEYDLFQEFFKFLNDSLNVKIEPEFVKAKSFGELYATIKNGKSGFFGTCSFSITEKRKQEIQFSPKYMPDIEVLICSQNFEVVTDTNDFIRLFSGAKALSVPNTTFEQNLQWLKKTFPKIQIENVQNSSVIRERISNEPNLFSYIELPNYFSEISKGRRLKRQLLFKVERSGYAVIYPKTSDWTEIVELFFNSYFFKEKMNEIIKNHLGESVNDLLWDVASEKNLFKDKEILILTKEREIQDLEIQRKELSLTRQKYVRNTLLGGVAVSVIILFLIYNRYRLKQKANEIISAQKNEVEKQKEIVEQKSKLVEQNYILLEEKNKEILDSIRYAKRIQDAILPQQKLVQQYLENSFILYKPKDIVAGDFYWLAPLKPSQFGSEHPTHKASASNNVIPTEENLGRAGILFACCDCTGHGVPGAFVSIIAHNALNRAVKECGLTQPATILDKVNELMEEIFSKSETDIKDGMDIALVNLTLNASSADCDMASTQDTPLSFRQKPVRKFPDPIEEVMLQYAGAGNSLYLVRKIQNDKLPTNAASYQLTEIPADKQPIGKFANRKPFTNHEIELQNGDSIYIFTDGYADQFGGPKEKRFKYEQFEKLLVSIQDRSMCEQREILNQTIDEWKGEMEQIDDICIIGVRV